jgi:hypothetical protein
MPSIIMSLRGSNNFWEELISYFPVIRHGPHKKDAAIDLFIIYSTRNLQNEYCLESPVKFC